MYLWNKIYFSFWNKYYYSLFEYPLVFEDSYSLCHERKLYKNKKKFSNRQKWEVDYVISKFSTRISYTEFPEYEHFWYFTYRQFFWRLKQIYILIKLKIKNVWRC